uniref:Uncharacterized protein n=1 Tax=Caenorhabditis japonica TaxID=281687 RepID=A0A8R1DFF2_CAEJA
MDELRSEIGERNKIIMELEKDLRKLEIKNDLKYLEAVGGINRVKMLENKNLNMSCSAIMSRILPSDLELKPLKKGVAFARIVYTDYEMIEKQVSMSYHPQNAFCFAIDRKAPARFHERLRAMAECLPNVLLLPDEKPVDSSGHNVNLAHYNCLRALINKPGWSYAILLQNHDVITKSVYEMEQIYEWLGGANDVEITPEAGRVDKKFEWDPRSLKLFRNESGIDEKVLNTTMKFAKGAAQGSLSRAAVDWMVRTADLSTYIAQWNKGMMPSFDYSIIDCTAELLYNRTFLGQEDHKLEEDYYTNMVNVLYHKHHLENDYKLNCTPSYKRWAERQYPV